ncbi:hypothetical protein GCM10018785_21810 [Streptomyces longispororuber]|uniref:Uncharacterized protein n=1 Tax=Streptomyces longispororuber TaxID=68230 RepID=A0A918ZHH8_9ACTN|nr:hypothetical protein GCM10018785_21810 [Streptomyces longispororuber]
MGEEAGARAARSRALAVLRIRGRALAVALLPAAVAVVLLAATATGHVQGAGWAAVRWAVTVLAVVVLGAAAVVALVVARARPALSPTVPITEAAAPDLYRLVRDLADRLDVPAPSAIALTPDCDSWLEDRTHPGHDACRRRRSSGSKGSSGSASGSASRSAGNATSAASAEPSGSSGPGSARSSASPTAAEALGDPDPGRIRGGRGARRAAPAAPVLVIGSPFLWWMRVGELRAVLAPVVAGTGPSAHPDIAAARRFVRGLDAAVAVAVVPGRGPVARTVLGGVGRVARLLLRSCRTHAAEMERGVAAAAAERAQTVDYGARIVAQEQVGLAYAGWDRLLTRVALPAWRMGRWPSRLDAGVVSALTELSRRDRLADGFASRLGERPACDLLEEPGAVDEAASLLAARLFHGGPAEAGPGWAPVAWQEYPDEVVDRKWRMDAARLHRVLDSLGVSRSFDPEAPDPEGPTLGRVLDHLTDPAAAVTVPETAAEREPDPHGAGAAPYDEVASGAYDVHGGSGSAVNAPDAVNTGSPVKTVNPVNADSRASMRGVDGVDGPDGAYGLDGDGADGVCGPDSVHGGADSVHGTVGGGSGAYGAHDADGGYARHAQHAQDPEAVEDAETTEATEDAEDTEDDHPEGPGSLLAAGLSAELAREEAAAPARPVATGPSPDGALWDDGALPLFPLQPPRTGRELLADHVSALVCCAAIDTAGAVPGLDWLDGPSLLIGGERAADLTPRVLTLVEEGDPGPLRAWLAEQGVRPEKPLRLV